MERHRHRHHLTSVRNQIRDALTTDTSADQSQPARSIHRDATARAPSPTVLEDPMSKKITHVLTAVHTDGSPLGPLGTTSVSVYGRRDLRTRLAAAKDRPDVVVTVRRATRRDRRG